METPAENTEKTPPVDWRTLSAAAVCAENPQIAEYVAILERHLAKYPADWSRDSSLETWFPLTAKRIADLEKLESEKSRMDWLESNILALFHGRATCSVQMDGRNVTLQYTDRNHRKLRLSERSIRAAIDAAMEVSK